MNLQALSPMEEQVYTLWQAGKSNKEIAVEVKTSSGSVRVIKTKITKKYGEDVVNTFGNQKASRAEHTQIQRKDLPNILSPLEYMIFLEMEKSQKSYQLIAKLIGTTEPFVKKSVHYIKQKLGPDFSRFFEKRLEAEQECWEHCGNCFRLKAKVHNNGSQTIVCKIHGQKTYKSDGSDGDEIVNPLFIKRIREWIGTKDLIKVGNIVTIAAYNRSYQFFVRKITGVSIVLS